jgi:hypothetical protein
MTRLNCLQSCLAIILLIGLAGCGKKEFVPLTGKVTLDGHPLPTAIVTFFNSGDGPAGYANVSSDGTYVAKTGSQEGLKPGSYRISVVANKPEVITHRAEAKIPVPITPPKYASPDTSGFSYTLTDSGGTFDIPLLGK